MSRIKQVKVSNVIYDLGDTPRVYQPNLHESRTSTATGYHMLSITSTLSWMLSFTVRLYQGYVFKELHISGYNKTSAVGWTNPAVMDLSDGDGLQDVHFGYPTASPNTLLVFIPAGNYYGIDVTNVTNGYTQIPESDLQGLFKHNYMDSLNNAGIVIQSTVTPTKILVDSDVKYEPTVTSATAGAHAIGVLKVGASTTTLYAKNTTYSTVGANGTTGLVKNGSSVTSATGYTACPIISGVPYYKESSGSVSQVQADWNTTDATAASYIKNKPTSMTVPGSLTINHWGGNLSNWRGLSDQTIVVIPPDGGIKTAMLADLSVTTAKIAGSAVTSAKLASNAVTTAKITNGNVTNAKLQYSSMTLNGSSVSLGGTATLPCIMNWCGTNYEVRIIGSSIGYEFQCYRAGTWITFGYITSNPPLAVNRILANDNTYYIPESSEYVLSPEVATYVASGRVAISELLPDQKRYPDAKLCISTPAIDLSKYPNLVEYAISNLRSCEFTVFGPTSSELSAIQKAGGYMSADITVDVGNMTATVRVNTQSDIK